MELVLLTKEYDAALAALIRRNLEAAHLDIPGTAYYDNMLDHLSAYYDAPGRAYYVLIDEGTAVGGVGLAKFDGLINCCELQKLYLDDSVKGRGLGYKLLDFIEERADEIGYERMYLETHTNLEAAIHLYEKAGFTEIEKPQSVVHTTMDRFFIKELKPGKKQLERIAKYEKMLDEAEALLASGETGERLTELARALEAYYTSDDWKRDFADDEAGKLPKDLKRGVLSEDGIYNLLERCTYGFE